MTENSFYGDPVSKEEKLCMGKLPHHSNRGGDHRFSRIIRSQSNPSPDQPGVMDGPFKDRFFAPPYPDGEKLRSELEP